MTSIESSGLYGIKTGFKTVADNAEKFVQSFGPNSDSEPVDAVVGMIQGSQQVRASAKVIQVAEGLKGTLLDIMA